jgi:hypothetical protein
MKNIGVLLDSETGDLEIRLQYDWRGKIISGLVVGDVTRQNQYLILVAQPGEFKEVPEVGVGLGNITLDNDLLAWRTKIRQQLESEGMIINILEFDAANELLIDAEYIK